MRWLVVLLILSLPMLSAGRSTAQQTRDPVLLQKTLGVLRQQREQATDAAAQEAVRNIILTEEIARLKAELDALKKPKEGAGQ